MKKILLIILLFASTLLTVKTYGQLLCNGGANACDLIPQDVRIEIVGDPVCAGGFTTVTFNINFKLAANNGNKQINFHTWLANEYPAEIGTAARFPCNGGGTEDPYLAAGVTGALGGSAQWGLPGFSILDIGLLNSPSVLPIAGVPQTTPMVIRPSNGYAPDNTVLLTSPTGPDPKALGMLAWKTRLLNGLDSISMTSVVVRVQQAVCGAAIAYKSLVWASQSENGQKAQCYAINSSTQVFNDPDLSITKICTPAPRKYSFSITTSNTVLTPFHWSVVLQAPVSPFTAFEINSGDVDLIASVNGGVFSFGPTDMPLDYGTNNLYRNWTVRLDVTSSTFSTLITTGNINAACGLLPIKLRSFDANRNKSNVDLKWVTEIETNNKGFYIERKLSNGEWEQVTYVASKASNGNSTSPLTYVLTDFNNTKGISQYRLKQVDIDGKETYSMIRSVRGEGQKANTIIYPNPSGDGKVNIVFEGTNSIRDVSLMDVSGKTLRQWKGVTNNNIHIENLNAGFYTVRIVDVQTGEQVVEKFIVNKR